jgi:hypothetical protein
MRLTKGFYESELSMLRVEVVKVSYDHPTKPYVKAKLTISNKKNGIVYETKRNYKLIKDKISHWKKVF